MTRINTNVSSLVAQNTLARSHDSLNQALTRLSTGLRINSGQDDPAGLIASENLRSDITSIQGAITNTDAANEVIGTADSALGQVSSLLNDIRGLVTQSANTGALSDAQIAANQLQVDSSLKALNRIAQTTTFQGRRLLDGSLDFITTAGTGFGTVSDLKIDTANLGSTGSIGVAVTVASAATQAVLHDTAIPTATTPAAASATLTLTGSATSATGNVSIPTVATQATGTLQFDSEATGTLTLSGQTFNLKALNGGNAAAAEGNAAANLAITFNAGSASTSYVAGTHTLNVSVTQASATATIQNVIDAINGGTDFAAAVGGATASTTVATGDDAAATFALTGGQDSINLTALSGGNAAAAEGNAAANLVVAFGQGSASTSYNATSHTLTVNLTQASGTATEQNVLDAINGGTDFTATAGANASATLATGDAATAVFGLTGGQAAGSNSIAVTAAAGAAGSNLTFAIVEGSGIGATPTVTNSGNAYTIHVDDTVATSISAIATAIAGISGVSSATTTSTANYHPTADTPPASAATLSGGTDARSHGITVTATTSGVNTHTVSLVEASGHGAATAALDGSGNIVVTVDSTASTSLSSIASVIGGLTGYTASVNSGGTGAANYVGSSDTPPSAATLAGGASAAGGLDSDIVFELSGATGADVLSFGAGTDIGTIVAAINSGSDSTGVTATNNAGTLDLKSTAYGSNAFVSLKVLSGDTNGTFAGGLNATRSNGTDINATVNGIQASGNGNTLSINTASLDLSLTVNAGSSTAVNFTINGGGALFQLGPEVVSNQQARIGITSVNTAKLGGTDGKLFQLGSGGVADLNSDPTKAASIVDEAINQITSLRGRLGAFQRTSLETNKNALNDTLVNLTDAQSNIRDADFASETANLTRAQILVQSGTTVLQIANQNPQNVLALLRQ